MIFIIRNRNKNKIIFKYIEYGKDNDKQEYYRDYGA